MDVRLKMDGTKLSQVIRVLRTEHRFIAPGCDDGWGALVVNMPQLRLTDLDPDTDVGPCAGYVRAYQAQCNYYSTTARHEFIRWIKDLDAAGNHGVPFVLVDF